ncbi:MAG: TatD family hydrolase [Acidobacteriota bacterium]|nr:TatD family hydrolase [Acidobacteriota bacterium]
MPALFDAHCHLQTLPPGEAASALDRAREAGVTRVACCATGEEDWEAVLALARAHREVVPLLGVHPWKAAEARPGWEERLEALLLDHRAGVGECGLDFARRGVDRETQLDALRRQLRMAARLHRPVVLHCVRAWGALTGVLQQEGVPPAGAMLHAFNGSLETARALQALGLFLSFRAPGPGLAAVREDRLLLESDGPEPAQVAALWAEASSAGTEAADLTPRNAERFFGGLLS